MSKLPVVVAGFLLVSCVRQPHPMQPRPVTLASVDGDSSLATVRTAPRPGDWSDDVIIETPTSSYVAIFEFSSRGRAKVRVSRGGEARAVSSIHWRMRGTAMEAKAPRYSGGVAGQTTCVSEGFAGTDARGQPISTPITCTDHLHRSSYSPAYMHSQRVELRPVLIVVADSAFRWDNRAAVLRRFAEVRGDVGQLQALAHGLVPDGRWAAIVHSPRQVQ